MRADITLRFRDPQPTRSRPLLRARVSVTVPQKYAERLRHALFVGLRDRIERLVSEPGFELGKREPMALLHIVLQRDAIDEALHVVVSTVRSAQLGCMRCC